MPDELKHGDDADDTAELPALLARLDRTWHEAGGAWLDDLRPGLSPAQIDSLTAELPIRLPLAARIWFNWHDGTTLQIGHLGHTIGGSGLQFLSLAGAIHYYHVGLRVALDAAAMDQITPAQAGWDPTWFPLMADLGGGAVTIDCTTPPHQPAPLRYVDKADMDPETIDAPSLAAVVRVWLNLHGWGAFHFNPDNDEWERTDDYYPDRGFTARHPPPAWLGRGYGPFA